MLVDHRTYRVKPGRMQAHLDIYEKYGYPTQIKHLGKPLAFMVTESGDMNTIVHIWVYENAADREKRRAAMAADPDWQAYLKKNAEAENLENQTTRLMTPVKFIPFAKP